MLILFLSLAIVQSYQIKASSDTEVNVLYDAQDEVKPTYKLKIIIEGAGKLVNEETGAYVNSNDIVTIQKHQKLIFRMIDADTLTDVIYDNKHVMDDIEGNRVTIYGKGKDTILRFIFKTQPDKTRRSLIPVITGDKTNTLFFTILVIIAFCLGAYILRRKKMKE